MNISILYLSGCKNGERDQKTIVDQFKLLSIPKNWLEVIKTDSGLVIMVPCDAYTTKFDFVNYDSTMALNVDYGGDGGDSYIINRIEKNKDFLLFTIRGNDSTEHIINCSLIDLDKHLIDFVCSCKNHYEPDGFKYSCIESSFAYNIKSIQERCPWDTIK